MDEMMGEDDPLLDALSKGDEPVEAEPVDTEAVQMALTEFQAEPSLNTFRSLLDLAGVAHSLGED
jgi:hypothetical protein